LQLPGSSIRNHGYPGNVLVLTEIAMPEMGDCSPDGPDGLSTESTRTRGPDHIGLDDLNGLHPGQRTTSILHLEGSPLIEIDLGEHLTLDAQGKTVKNSGFLAEFK
jgi:hypothetical protein